MMNPRDRSTYIPLDQVDPSIFFIIDTMKVGSITKPPMPYRTEDGKQAMRIIYLKSNTPPHQANLKDDYQKLAAYALNEKRRKALSEPGSKKIKIQFTSISIQNLINVISCKAISIKKTAWRNLIRIKKQPIRCTRPTCGLNHEISKIIIGQDEVVRLVLTAIFSPGALLAGRRTGLGQNSAYPNHCVVPGSFF